MKGNAPHFFSTLSYSQQNCFEELVEAIRQNYTTNVYSLKARLKASKQHPGQGIATFLCDARTLARQAYRDQPDLIEQTVLTSFIEGLSSSTLRWELRNARPYSVDAPLTFAIQLNFYLELEGINGGSSTITAKTTPKAGVNQLVNPNMHANTVVFDEIVRALKRNGDFSRSSKRQNSYNRSRNERRDYDRGRDIAVVFLPVPKSGISTRISHKIMTAVVVDTIAMVANMTAVTIHVVVTVKDMIPVIENLMETNPFVLILAEAAIRATETAAMMMATEMHNVPIPHTDATVFNEDLKHDETAGKTQGIGMILADIANERIMLPVTAKFASTAFESDIAAATDAPQDQIL